MSTALKSLLVVTALAAAPRARAQGISDAPLQSTRAEAMGGAIPTLADDKDAVFENPAGIGGTRWGKTATPWVKKLYFPFVAASADKASASLIKEVRASGAIEDSTVGKAIVDANAGERQYARINAGMGLVLGRILVVPYYDNQILATAKGGGTNLIDFREVSTSGVAFGTSATSSDESLSLGYSGYLASRADLAGEFLYDDIIDKTARAKLMKDNTTKASALGHNAGVTWRMGKRANPTLAVVLKNAGGTKYKVTSGTGEAQTVAQDLTAAFSVSPQLGKSGEFSFSLAADRLMDSDVSFVKKYHAGMELLLFGAGSYARVGLRGGYNDAGASGGVTLNLGLIGVSAGVNSVDIGAGNQKLVEHRRVGEVFVNVADF